MLLLIIATSLLLCSSCDKTLTPNQNIDRAELSFLKEGLSYEDISNKLGESKPIYGVTTIWYEYTLKDNSKLRILFIHPDSLYRAVIQENNETELCLVCEKKWPVKDTIDRSDLSFLEKGISFNEVFSHIGEPQEDIGSGFYIFRYSLQDGSILQLTFVNLDDLDQASIIKDKQETILLVP